ncbi:uncharacterized protein LOC108465797 [Gossypium arboreum]|uniref:uncharacterized protein LOC108465797 n=1 Tax=Gossypium arboreum TaxID=29729 RepID=UPI00081947A8|nr:uncharacterized protein LOC108465797 [Gossypium arboreum]
MNNWYTEFMRANPNAQAPPPPPPLNPQPVLVMPQNMYFMRFARTPVGKIRKQGAEEFRANTDDDAERAELWLENSIRVFGELSCMPDECLKCAISLMRDDAYHWWKSLISVVPKEAITWDKYARECVPTEAKMCHRFEDGLNEDIKVLVGILELKEFVVLVERACRAEELMKEKKKAESEARDVKKRIMSRSAPTQSKKLRDVPPRSYASIGRSHGNRNKQGSSFRTQATSMASVDDAKPCQFECQHCGKRHSGWCRRNVGTCFGCGSPDHFVRDCPEMGEKLQIGRQSGLDPRGRPLKNTGSGAGSKNTTRETVEQSELRTPARVYAIRAREEASSPNVITDTFSFYDQYVIALIDPGSTHSCICMTLASSMNLLVVYRICD